jgi:hypothetical protein
VEARLNSYEQAALEVVREAAGEVLATGRAEIRLRPAETAPVGNPGDFLIEIVPTNPKACRMLIFPTEYEISFWLGEDEILDELFQKHHDERLHELRLRVGAVVAGRYAERWHQVRRPWPFRSNITQLVGHYLTENGDRQFSHQGCEPEGLELERHYEPY